MVSITILSMALAVARLTPHTDYDFAFRQAVQEKKDLVIYFRDDGRLEDVLKQATIRDGLSRYVFLEISSTYQHHGKRLLDHAALAEMSGRGGLAVVSLHDERLPSHQELISAHPFVRSRYGWAPAYGSAEVRTILDLPSNATLTQRSMMYAVRVHPERPRSIHGEAHGAFLSHARRHSQRQANQRHQHHADLISTSHVLQSESGCGVGSASEVVAESWGAVGGGENVLEAAFSCVDAWRHSSGHWSAVSRSHRYFGYDLARGANGTWYATGIFAD